MAGGWLNVGGRVDAVRLEDDGGSSAQVAGGGAVFSPARACGRGDREAGGVLSGWAEERRFLEPVLVRVKEHAEAVHYPDASADPSDARLQCVSRAHP